MRDLARWASLTQTQARPRPTEAAAPRLAELTVTGEPLWFDPAAPEPPADGRVRGAAAAAVRRADADLPGAWASRWRPGTRTRRRGPVRRRGGAGRRERRDLAADGPRAAPVQIEVALAPGRSPAEREAVAAAAGRAGRVPGRGRLDLTITA